MKRQLERLKGKRLVTGDPNLMTKDEICINATPNGVEVKEIGTDGKIKDLAGSEGGGGVYNLLPTLNEFIDKYKYIYVWKTEVRASGTRIWLEKAIYKVSNIDGTSTLFIENNKTGEQIINLIFRDKEINIEDSQLDVNACPNLYLEAGDDIKFAIIFELVLQNYIGVVTSVMEVNDINLI